MKTQDASKTEKPQTRSHGMIQTLILLAVFAAVRNLAMAQDCIEIPGNSSAWQQMGDRTGRIQDSGQGLVLFGGSFTNGALVNGRMDGNGVVSRQTFDLSGGGDVYLIFGVSGGGKYMGVYPTLFTGVGARPITTHHSWAGSTVIPENQWLYAHLSVRSDLSYALTVCQGDYDVRGGSTLYSTQGRLNRARGRVEISYVDNYASEHASLTIFRADVCAAQNQHGNGNGFGNNGFGNNSGNGSVFVAGSRGDRLARDWYVGTYPSKIVAGRVYCAIASQSPGDSAAYKLAVGGFHNVAFGPATFDECVTWVESNGNRWWPVSEECWIGARTEADGTVRYSIAENTPTNPASYALTVAGYPSIVFGPATWQDCVAWLQARGAQGW